MTQFNAKARHRARRLALQAMYQWQFQCNSPIEIETQFMVEQTTDKADIAYFKELLHEVPKHIQLIDEEIKTAIDRPFVDLTAIELAVLRIAVYEFVFRVDVPYRVVINEALELTKTFGATEAHKYVNGVLDKLAQKLRKAETNR